MSLFHVSSEFSPQGDQEQAIANWQISSQEAEIEKFKSTRTGLIIMVALMGIICYIIVLALRSHQRNIRLIRLQKQLVDAEREKSEQLLLNILPKETAAELKVYGSAMPRPSLSSQASRSMAPAPSPKITVTSRPAVLTSSPVEWTSQPTTSTRR